MTNENSKKLFRLKWDNHLQNLSCLFESLYVQQKYVDATISCEGGTLKAHKVILSACSPYFEQIFKDHPCKHPVVIIQDVKLREMQMVLEYMYKGELNVLEEELNAFVSIASLLDVRGLSNNLTTNKPVTTQDTTCIADEGAIMDPLFQSAENGVNDMEILPTTSSSYDQNLDDVSPDRQSTPLSFTDVLHDMLGRQSGIEAIPRQENTNQQPRRPGGMFNNLGSDPKRMKIKEETPTSPIEYFEQGVDTTGEMNEQVDKTECRICKLQFLTPALLQTHLLEEHNYTEDYRPHRCEFCPLAFFRSAHLKRHRRLHTGEKPFECELCGKSFSRQDKLKQHVQRHGPQHVVNTRGRGTVVRSVATPRNPRNNNRQQLAFSDYHSSLSQQTSAEQLLRSVQDLGECIIQPCLPKS